MKREINLFSCLLFLFFFTLHADQLNVGCYGFTLRLNNLVAVVVFLFLIARFRLKAFQIDRQLFKALTFLTLSILLSFLTSPYIKRCFFFFGWYGFTLFFYLILPYLLVSLMDVEKIMRLYLFSFFAVGLYALLQLIASLVGIADPFASQQMIDVVVRPNAFAYEPSFYALYMTPFVMMVNFDYLTERQGVLFSFKPITLRTLLFMNALYVVSTSTSAIFAYLIFFSIVFWISKIRRKLIYFIFLFLFAGLGIWFCFPDIMKNYFIKFLVFGFMSHHSFFDRLAMIYNCWHLFLEHPFFGVGLGGIPSALYDAWAQGELSYLFIWQDQALFSGLDNSLKPFEPSNVLTEALASLGMLGVGAILFLLVTFFQQAKRTFRHAPTLVSNIVVTMLVMLIVLQINQGLFRTYVWTHFAMMFALLKKIETSATTCLELNARSIPQLQSNNSEPLQH